jgi:hypothetical protein
MTTTVIDGDAKPVPEAKGGGNALRAAVVGVKEAATSRFTGRPMVFSAVRQLIFGLMAAAVTYGAARLIGMSVS